MTLTCSRSKISICMLHTPPMPKFYVSLYDELLLCYAPFVGKVHWMIPNILDMFKDKNINMHATYTPEAQILSVSLYDEPFLRYGPFLRKVHWMTLNDLDMFKDKNTNMHIHTPLMPKFSSICSTMTFLVKKKFVKGAQNGHKMTLTCSRLKVFICIQYTPHRPKISSVSLYDEPFLSYVLNFLKSAWKDPQMTLTCSRPKIPIFILHTCKTHIFVCFALLWDICEPILWKVHQMTPKGPWHVQG